MENKTFNLIEEKINKNVEETMKWFTETGTLISDAYNKQLQLGFQFSNKIMASISGTENSPVKFFEKNIELFKTNLTKYNALAKEMIVNSFDLSSKPADKEKIEKSVDIFKRIATAISETINEQNKVFTELNEKYFASVTNQFKDSNIKEFSDKLQGILKENVKISEISIKKIIDSYTSKSDFSSDANKKLIDEINNLIDSTTKTTMDFWSKMPENMKFTEAEVVEPDNVSDAGKSSKKTNTKK